MGITHFLTTNFGDKVENPKYYKKSQNKLKRAQRNLSRKYNANKDNKKKKLMNIIKAKRKVAILHEKIKNQRSDFLHKASHKIINENKVVYLENLNIKGMMKNRHCAKSLADVSWGEFVRQIKYKASWKGVIVAQIGRFDPSSKLCSNDGCSYKNPNLKLSQREWTCPDCNTVHDRDINAAKNILKIGREKIGRGTAELEGIVLLTPVEKSANVCSIQNTQACSMKQESLAS